MFSQATPVLVSLAAVFSIVTQRSFLWGGALRDDTKNGCEGDYACVEYWALGTWEVFYNIVKAINAEVNQIFIIVARSNQYLTITFLPWNWEKLY